jgi:hypothetical protein
MPEFNANISPYSYIGDIPALGSLQLTMLAQSFEQIEVGQLDDYFPDMNVQERTINIEQVIEGLGIMPVVQFNKLSGGYVEPERVRKMTVDPAVIREDDFVEEALINQLRAVGTFNTAINPAQFVQNRVQKLVNRHKRTVDLFRAKVLLGGIDYIDPRTSVGISVSTNIPTHNFFRYDGWNASVALGTLIPVAGTTYSAAKALTNNKGRVEAVYFTSSDGRIGVPWTDSRADIARGLILLRRFLQVTNKNRFTEIVISQDLLTVIQSTNEYIKAYLGQPGIMINNFPSATVAGNSSVVAGGNSANPSLYQMGPGGDLLSIGGLRIRAMDGYYRDPSDSIIKTYWPAHKVALVAPQGTNNAGAKLGMTYHCSGEAPGGAPGVFMRSEPTRLPAPSGMLMQMGDAFLPFAIYPHWICVMDVAEPTDITDRIPLQSLPGFGTF